jgi:hypothetical protein
MKNLLARLRPYALIGGFGGLVLVLALAAVLDFGFGQDLIMVAPHEPGTVEVNRALYLQGDPVAELYGNPLEKSVRLIGPNPARMIRPEEDAGLVLYQVDKQQGENPLQARTVWLFAKASILGFGLLGLAGLVFPRKRNDPMPTDLSRVAADP